MHTVHHTSTPHTNLTPASVLALCVFPTALRGRVCACSARTATGTTSGRWTATPWPIKPVRATLHAWWVAGLLAAVGLLGNGPCPGHENGQLSTYLSRLARRRNCAPHEECCGYYNFQAAAAVVVLVVLCGGGRRDSETAARGEGQSLWRLQIRHQQPVFVVASPALAFLLAGIQHSRMVRQTAYVPGSGMPLGQHDWDI